MPSLGVVISYCTHDFRFIAKCIEETRRFAKQIIIPVCDHFFNGKPENRALLEHTYAEHPDCEFVEFAYTPARLYNPFSTFVPSDEEWIRLWHQTSRYIGFLHLRPEIEFLFFIDCDEIPEGDRIAAWLRAGVYRNYNAMRLLGYYYALTPTLRAKKLQNLSLLVRRAALEPRFFFHPDERYALYRYVEEPKQYDVRDQDLKPLFHHYSWVRPSHECLQKSDSWGHKRVNDWQKEIERSFKEKGQKDLFGNCNLDFEEISKAYFNPLSISIPKKPLSPKNFPHVKKVTPHDIFQLELELTYGLSDHH